MYPKIFLKEEKTASIYRRHRWIFSGAIARKDKKINDGEIVEVVDNKGDFLAIGHYFSGSIAVRILSFENEIIDKKFWTKKILNAFNFRRNVLNLPNEATNAFRLIFGEADGLPGLIVDIFDDLAVIQCHNIAIYNAIDEISEVLQNLPLKINHIFNKSQNLLVNMKDAFIFGKCENNKIIIENSLKFTVDFVEGQKTGFFLDQKINRNFVKQYAANKRVLNLFSYSGSFSVYALAGGATEVTNVDISEIAINSAKKNISLNFEDSRKTNNVVSDVFEFLKNEKSKYDLIIVDPPAFAKNVGKEQNALQAYRKLNEAAMRLLAPNGLFFTFSCSGVVSREKFQQSVFIAATNNKRSCKIVANLYQAPDHPIDLFHPETNYLKGLLLSFD